MAPLYSFADNPLRRYAKAFVSHPALLWRCLNLPPQQGRIVKSQANFSTRDKQPRLGKIKFG